MRSHLSRAFAFALAGLAWGLAANPAWTFCIYRDEIGRKPTLAEEYADADLVVVATAVSATADADPEDPEPGAFAGTHYRLRVDRVFKGRPPKRLRLYSDNTTARFDPEIGRPYLLFLEPPYSGSWKAKADDAFVNNNCGNSEPWDRTRADRRRLLERLSRPARTARR